MMGIKENIELLEEAIFHINYVRNLIYQDQWENAELLFKALNALTELRYNIESEKEQ